MAIKQDELERFCEGRGYTVAPENTLEDIGPPPKMETGVAPPQRGQSDWRMLKEELEVIVKKLQRRLDKAGKWRCR